MQSQEKTGVTMREYVDMQVEFVRKELDYTNEKIKFEKELGEKTDVLKEAALRLQADKYEQRLTSLNHEAQRLSTMVSSEMFNEVVSSIRKEIEDTRKEVKIIQLWVSNFEGKQARAQLIGVAAAIIALLALILPYFK